MKKLITIMLVAMIPFITMAQKKSKKDKKAKQEVKTPTVNFMVIKGVSFSEGYGDEQKLTDMMTQDMMGQESMHEKIIRISFDFGSQPNNKENKEVYRLMERSRGLHSMTDAVNMLSQEGWEFVSANIVQQGRVTTYYYYMQRK